MQGTVEIPYSILIIAVGAVFALGLLVLAAVRFKKVEQGQALIINKISGEPVVTFSGGIVLPFVHKAEVMDTTMKTIRIECHGRDGLLFADGETRSVVMRFYVRVNNMYEDVLRVARSVGAKRAGDLATIEDLFVPKFLHAMKAVARKIPSTELEDRLVTFQDDVLRCIGMDLGGYVLEDAVLDFTHQAKTSVSHGEQPHRD